MKARQIVATLLEDTEPMPDDPKNPSEPREPRRPMRPPGVRPMGRPEQGQFSRQEQSMLKDLVILEMAGLLGGGSLHVAEYVTSGKELPPDMISHLVDEFRRLPNLTEPQTQFIAALEARLRPPV